MGKKLAAARTLANTVTATNIANQIESFINAIIPYVWIVVAFSLIGVGCGCILGTEKSRMAAKEKAPYIFVGCILVLGSVYIGKYLASSLAFTGAT